MGGFYSNYSITIIPISVHKLHKIKACFLCTFTNFYFHIHSYIFSYAFLYIFTYVPIYFHMHSYIFSHMFPYIFICIPIYFHICSHIFSYAKLYVFTYSFACVNRIKLQTLLLKFSLSQGEALHTYQVRLYSHQSSALLLRMHHR